jgi:CBS domain containing-hemolysin-like protein
MNTDYIIVIVTLLFSGFFSGLEIAFVSSSRLKQELDLKKNHRQARILSLFYKNPSRFIGALLLGNNIALVGYGIVMARLLEKPMVQLLPGALQTEFFILLIQTVISTLLILITAEFLPKILFRINPNAILKFFAVPVWLFYIIFYPLIVLYIGIAEFLLKKVFRIHLTSDTYTFSAVDLDEYIKDYQPEEEEENTQDIQMIQNAMEFKNVKLRDCMVPRTEIVAIDIDDNIDRLVKLFIDSGHSKIMVFEGDIDNLIGYLHAYDVFSHPESLKSIVRKVDVYPETMPAKDLLNEFIKNHKSVAIVVDEFGGTSGMVTMEDIIEEIFGEIEDEYDTGSEKEEQLSENKYLFSTRLEIDYLNEKYNLNIPESEEYETLAGFILHHHESIPRENELIEIPPFTFEVTKASKNRLEEVKLTLLPVQESSL